MAEIVSLALPFFGLIALGFAAPRFRPIPVEGLAWMNFFIVYVALPALFYVLLSRTPIEKLTNWTFIIGCTLGTYLAFSVAFVVGHIATRGDVARATIQGLGGAYGNIGYMGPGLAIAALGPEAAVPAALILCFDNTLHFILAPSLMALAGEKQGATRLQIAREIIVKVVTHPFILATAAGVTAAALRFEPPGAVQTLLDYLYAAAAPCALFAMGVTVALSPRGTAPKVLGVLVPIKLVLHPLIIWLLLGWIGDFDPIWSYTAILFAALPTATNVFVIAQQYDSWVNSASGMILFSTLASVVTITSLLAAITSGWLPADPFP